MFSDMPMPFFMKDSTWYYFDDKTETIRLTEVGEKIPEVVASYSEYYNDDDGLLYQAWIKVVVKNNPYDIIALESMTTYQVSY